jgi:large conductance mechanosensitive channel
MGLFKEFKEFAMRGNVVDLAVGVIIGAAFGKIVTSMVNDIIMPIIGTLVGKVDFKDLSIILAQAETNPEGKIIKEAVTLKYGMFIQNVFDFLIVAFCIFMAIKAMNKFNRKKSEEKPSTPPEPSNEEKLLAEIRDLLKK